MTAFSLGIRNLKILTIQFLARTSTENPHIKIISQGKLQMQEFCLLQQCYLRSQHFSPLSTLMYFSLSH